MDKNTVRLNFEFPREYYPYLKMTCAERGQSLREFASSILIREIEENEERLLAEKARTRLHEMDNNDNISFDEAARLAGWDDVR